MSIEKIRSEILILINKEKQRIQISANAIIETIPSNYAELQDAAVLKELKQEMDKLSNLFLNVEANEEELKTVFKELCRQRDLQNQNTCLSYTARPESFCNNLYVYITELLFSPANAAEMLEVIMPSVKHCLVVEASNFLERNIGGDFLKLEDRLRLKLTKINLKDFFKDEFKLSMLTEVVIANDIIFPLDLLKFYPLYMHVKLFELLSRYPLLKEKLYQHNDAFRKIFINIELMNKSGKTINEMLTHFARELKRSGAQFTGQETASNFIVKHYKQFYEYINFLPDDLRKSVLAMQTPDEKYSLEYILDKHLATGKCVEIAASEINNIQKNPHNAEILKLHPGTTLNHLQKIKRKYGRPIQFEEDKISKHEISENEISENEINKHEISKYRKPIDIIGFDNCSTLPGILLEELLKHIKVSTTSDYIDLFINLPTPSYLKFLTHTNILCSPIFPNDLGEALEMLNEAQRESFYDAILNLKQKFGGLSNILIFALKNNLTKLINQTFKAVPEEKRLPLIEKVYLYFYKDFSTDYYFTNILLSILQLLPESDKSHLINDEIKKGNNPFCRMLDNQLTLEKFLVVWNLIENKFFSVNEKNAKGNTNIQEAVQLNEPEIFVYMWESLSLSEKIFSAKERSSGGTVMLQFAAQSSHIKNWRTVSQFYRSEKLLNLHERSEFEDKTYSYLHWASLNTHIDAFCFVIDSLKAAERLPFMIDKSMQGDSPFHILIENMISLKSFRYAWKRVVPANRLAIVNNRNAKGQTFLQQLIIWKRPDLFLFVLQSLSRKQRELAILKKSKQGLTSLHYAARFYNEKIWKLIWKACSEKFKFAAITKSIKTPYYNFFYLAALSTPSQVTMDVYELLLKLNRLNEKDQDGNTLFHFLIHYYRSDLFIQVWKELTEVNRVEVLNALNNEKDTPLSLAVRLEDLTLFNFLQTWISTQNKTIKRKIKNINGSNLLKFHANAAFAEWETMWNYFSFSERDLLLKEIKVHNDYPTVFHWAAVTKQMWQMSIMLNRLSHDDKVDMLIKTQDIDKQNVLQCSLYHPEMFNLLWENLSEEQRNIASDVNTEMGMELLRQAFKTKNSVAQTLWDTYTTNQKHIAIKNKDKSNLTLLQFVIKNYSFKNVLVLTDFLSAHEKLNLFLDADKDGETILHYIAHQGNIDPFLLLLEVLPREDRCAALRVKNKKGKTPFHLLITNRFDNETLLIILKLLPSSNRFEVIMDEDDDKENMLSLAVDNHHLFHFHSFLESLTSEDRLKAALYKHKYDMSFLHYILEYSRFDVLRIMLELLPDDLRLIALKNKDGNGNTALHIAAKFSDNKMCGVIQNSISQSDFIELIEEKNVDGDTPLHYSAENVSPKIVTSMLQVLPQDKKIQMLREKNSYNETPLCKAAMNENANVFNAMISFLPTEEHLPIWKNDIKTQLSNTTGTLFNSYSKVVPIAPPMILLQSHEQVRQRRR